MEPCSDIGPLIASALYEGLEPEDARRLESHLAECSGCRREKAELEQASELARSGSEELTSRERASLLGAIASRTAGSRRRTYVRQRRPGPFVAAAAALAAAVLLVLATFPRNDESAPKPTAPPVAERPAPPAAPKPPPETVPETKTPPSPPVEPPAPAPPTPKPPTVTPEPPAPPAPEKPVEPPPPPPRTVAVVARVGQATGTVSLTREGRALELSAGAAAGDVLRTADRKSAAALVYPDGTRVFLGPETSVRVAGGAAKELVLDRGRLRADVAAQPEGRPMTFRTPHGTAEVLGTVLLLSAGADSSRLTVEKGRVRLTRTGDGASALVTAGRTAVAGPGAPPEATPARHTRDLMAFYDFREGAGRLIRDEAYADLPLDLQIRTPGAASWTAEGLTLDGRARIGSADPAGKIVRACASSREITVEVWLTPATATPGFEGAVFALSTDVPTRNVTLIQRPDGAYQASVRTTATDEGGRPALSTPAGLSAPRPTHLVYVRTGGGGDRLYVDGRERASGVRPGTFDNWDPEYRLLLGDEATEERPWKGTLRMIAVYARALTDAEIIHNFRAGAP